jgi:medium-chain acyl-[acyl-carrier-protein] hydrolase
MRSNLVVTRAPAGAIARVICIPYAGGSASAFRGWDELLPPDVECLAVQLPGRADRLAETPFATIEAVTDAVVRDIRAMKRRPLVLVGHSMGALVAFDVARALQERHGVPPAHLFVSARRAPHLPLPTPPLDDLPDDQFVEQVQQYGGIPASVAANQELMTLLLPTLRADFRLHRTYRYSPGAPLRCDVSALGGTNDPEVGSTPLEGWKQHTAGRFTMHWFSGNHFFIHTAQAEICALIGREVARWRPDANEAKPSQVAWSGRQLQ